MLFRICVKWSKENRRTGNVVEQLKYTIEDRTIVELLGVQNFTNKESAILELVKNAYDARAKLICINFRDNKIVIVDNGDGMSAKDIYERWMHVGKSDKGYWVEEEKTSGRVFAGSKGIGRFALARLGSHVALKSNKKGEDVIHWLTDWGESRLKVEPSRRGDKPGTEITISNLGDRWTDRAVQGLAEYLGITYLGSSMTIKLISDKEEYVVHPYYANPKLGKNFVSKINLKYDSEKRTLQCSVLSDEFLDSADEYLDSSISKNEYSSEVCIFQELKSKKGIDLSEDELTSTLNNLGNFDAEFYFSLKSNTKEDVEKFLYKHQQLSNRYENGVVLYRNSFSISSFEGRKDWLGLGRRVRKSPAATSHPTGTWHVRENQLSGKVLIDKKANKNLKDMANRQGFDEDVFYDLFVRIIITGIGEFERYRQSLIRRINMKNRVEETKKEQPLISRVIKNPESVALLSKSQAKELAKELIEAQDETKASKRERKDAEKRYKYDVRILNVFATEGLKAASIAHEMENDRNNLSESFENIINALKEYGMWDDLNSPEKTAHLCKNVPLMLENNKEISEKILLFMRIMLEKIEKQQYVPDSIDVSLILDSLKSEWERDYGRLTISHDAPENLKYYTAKDILMVIFNNLILNSVQQNSEDVKVSILVERRDEKLHFSYSDNGKGLDAKYQGNPERILAVHETSREEKGHGLGMWIVNNTLQTTGGRVVEIDGSDGFRFDFELGTKF